MATIKLSDAQRKFIRQVADRAVMRGEKVGVSVYGNGNTMNALNKRGLAQSYKLTDAGWRVAATLYKEQTGKDLDAAIAEGKATKDRKEAEQKLRYAKAQATRKFVLRELPILDPHRGERPLSQADRKYYVPSYGESCRADVEHWHKLLDQIESKPSIGPDEPVKVESD